MDFKELGAKAATRESNKKPIVAGRVLNYDADFACYEVSDLEETVNQSFSRLLDMINMKRAEAGAEFVNAFITLGTKSGREDIATVQPYQDTRDPNTPIKVRVRELRRKLAVYKDPVGVITPVHNPMYEADDLMVMHQHALIKKLGWEKSVIMSGDKDLWMAQGYHCDMKTGKLTMVKGYGKTKYKEVGNVKPKLVGEGRSWFWHQMIMGDKVDNIPGLEKMTARTLDRYVPLKSGARKPTAKPQAAGEAKAVAVLSGVTTDIMAARKVYECYEDLYGAEATERFMEQAYLLWMQRSEDAMDVEKYLKESCMLNVGFTEKQRKIIKGFMEAVRMSGGVL